MQFTFETLYNQNALSVMAKCIRKTVRKKRSKRSHIFGWIVFVFSSSHAQIYDKNTLSGGTVDEFRKFISEVTNKKIITVK